MTSSLDLIPWETPPAVEESKFEVEWKGGKFSIPKLGYLTIEELDFLGTVDPKNALNRLMYETSIELSKAINDKSDPQVWTYHRCYQFLLTQHFIHTGARVPLTPEEKTIEILQRDVVIPFLEEVTLVTNRVTIRAVTIMLNRIRHGWTDEQTCRLPAPLRQAIHSFYLEEQNADAPPIDPQEQIKIIEDMLGKSLGVSPSIATDQTGDKPTGSASGIGQPHQSSIETTSASFPAVTSSKPLKPARKTRGNVSTAKKLASAS